MRQTIFAFSCIATLCLSGITFSSFAQKNREEYGKCGYYADSFQGRPTSSGEKYDKNDLTCSHKSLPFGTRLRVTRLDNKKTVVVRVNDRGPFIEGYVVDVSGEAASELGLFKDGTTRVKTEVLTGDETAPATTAKSVSAPTGKTKLLVSHKDDAAVTPATYSTEEPQTSARRTITRAETTATTDAKEPESNLYKVDIKKTEKSGFGIQISTLSDANNVLPIVNKLQSQWPNKVMVAVKTDEANSISTYKIVVGPFTDKKAAETQQKLVAKKGYKKTLIVDLTEI